MINNQHIQDLQIKKRYFNLSKLPRIESHTPNAEPKTNTKKLFVRNSNHYKLTCTFNDETSL